VSGRPLPPGYERVHRALRRERGPASAHPCVDCGGPAAEWSLNDPVVANDFSEDLQRYSPRCRPCHRLYDTEARSDLAIQAAVKGWDDEPPPPPLTPAQEDVIATAFCGAFRKGR
jgi:hypothetical protein